MIIMDTLKGCGIDFIEDDYTWHYGAFDDETCSRKEGTENFMPHVLQVEKK